MFFFLPLHTHTLRNKPKKAKLTRKLCTHTHLHPSAYATRHATRFIQTFNMYNVCRIRNNRKITFDCDQKHFVFGYREKNWIQIKFSDTTHGWNGREREKKSSKKNNKQRTCVNRNVLASSYLVEMNCNRSKVVRNGQNACCCCCFLNAHLHLCWACAYRLAQP